MQIGRRQFVLGLVGFGATACGAKSSVSLAPTTSTATPLATPVAGATSTSTTVVPPTTIPEPTTTIASGPARYVNRGATEAKRVALTFHTEGTTEQVGRLLDMSKTLEVPLTMLIVGMWVEQNRSLGKRIADAGHDVGNHTYSHLSLPDQSREVVAREIRRGADVLRDATGTAGRWFRPSGSNSTTPTINEEAGKAGYPIVLGFDTDPLDYQDPGSSAVRSRVVAGAQAGSLVSLHAQHQGTIDVFESMVGALRDKGFTLVRASDIVR